MDNAPGWLTTVTARLCLDQLRARERHGEVPLTAEHISDTQFAADEEFLRREEVSRAVLVVLDELSPNSAWPTSCTTCLPCHSATSPPC